MSNERSSVARSVWELEPMTESPNTLSIAQAGRSKILARQIIRKCKSVSEIAEAYERGELTKEDIRSAGYSAVIIYIEEREH